MCLRTLAAVLNMVAARQVSRVCARAHSRTRAYTPGLCVALEATAVGAATAFTLPLFTCRQATSVTQFHVLRCRVFYLQSIQQTSILTPSPTTRTTHNSHRTTHNTNPTPHAARRHNVQRVTTKVLRITNAGGPTSAKSLQRLSQAGGTRAWIKAGRNPLSNR